MLTGRNWSSCSSPKTSLLTLFAGCAQAGSWISVYTVGQTAFSYITAYLEQQINNFCAGGAGISQTAVSITSAFSLAVAKVYGSWMQYACTAPQHSCCTRAQAETQVRGDGVAVAQAISYAFTEASSKLQSSATGTCAAALAQAFASSDAFAADTQLAVLKVPNTLVRAPPSTCTSTGIQELTRCNFASAFTCAVAKVLTSISADPTPDSGSCSDNIAITGVRDNAVLVCPNMCYKTPSGQAATPTPTCATDASGTIACTGTFYSPSAVTFTVSDQIREISPGTVALNPICPT
eukprot:jgi/Chrzof1/13285/Cz07g27160.t1